MSLANNARWVPSRIAVAWRRQRCDAGAGKSIFSTLTFYSVVQLKMIVTTRTFRASTGCFVYSPKAAVVYSVDIPCSVHETRVGEFWIWPQQRYKPVFLSIPLVWKTIKALVRELERRTLFLWMKRTLIYCVKLPPWRNRCLYIYRQGTQSLLMRSTQ